jgi:zinc/manganese transport system ATP-binding protein
MCRLSRIETEHRQTRLKGWTCDGARLSLGTSKCYVITSPDVNQSRSACQETDPHHGFWPRHHPSLGGGSPPRWPLAFAPSLGTGLTRAAAIMAHAHNHHTVAMTPLSPGAVITLENVTIAYQRHPAVHHLSGAFERGSLTALIGPNGAGKSTLLKAIVGLLPLSGGRITVTGRQHLGYLPQVTEVDRSFPMTVIEVVDLGHWRRIGALKRLTQDMRQRSRAALAEVGLAGFEDRPIASLSVGQFQRVLFARLIAADASLILLDEPFNAIDQRTIQDLMSLVSTWHSAGKTVIAALHDLDFVRSNFPQSLLLAREPIAWGATSDVLSASNLAAARHLADHWQPAAEICAA